MDRNANNIHGTPRFPLGGNNQLGLSDSARGSDFVMGVGDEMKWSRHWAEEHPEDQMARLSSEYDSLESAAAIARHKAISAHSFVIRGFHTIKRYVTERHMARLVQEGDDLGILLMHNHSGDIQGKDGS